MAGQHGGKRPGAGRNPGTVIAPEPILDLVELLERLPRTVVGRQRRCALALAAFGADDRQLSTALGIDAAQVTQLFGTDIDRGRIALRVNIRKELMPAALRDGRPFSTAVATAALKLLAPSDKSRLDYSSST
ncbi:hypothetical protein R1A27_14460 [Methylobacterium sp. NMS12]|uniref:hypothetical protein n=1 Tax=Methylobacterium sp. NMS12 TaxID=3079766 RepID=UPI003F8845B9